MGSSAAALTGPTFIVITIAADDGNAPRSASARLSGLRVFITPTAVHFGSALWLAAQVSMPGQTAVTFEVRLAATGLAGLTYCAMLLRRMLGRSLGYRPFASDRLWSVLLPVTGYLALAVAGFMMPREPLSNIRGAVVGTELNRATGTAPNSASLHGQSALCAPGKRTGGLAIHEGVKHTGAPEMAVTS